MSFDKSQRLFKYTMMGYIMLLVFLSAVLPTLKKEDVNIFVELVFCLPYIMLSVIAIILSNKKKKYAGIIGIVIALPSVIGVITNFFYLQNLIKIVFRLEFVACVLIFITSIIYTIKVLKIK